MIVIVYVGIDGSDVPSEELKLEKMVEKELRRERSSEYTEWHQ